MLPVQYATNRLTRMFPEFSALPQDMDQWFNQAWGARGQGFRVDIREVEDHLLIEAELPGLSRENIDITVEDGVLTIAAQYGAEQEQERNGYHLRERRHGRFERSFRMPAVVDLNQVAADLKDGILTVRVPKREEAKPRRIEVR